MPVVMQSQVPPVHDELQQSLLFVHDAPGGTQQNDAAPAGWQIVPGQQGSSPQ